MKFLWEVLKFQWEFIINRVRCQDQETHSIQEYFSPNSQLFQVGIVKFSCQTLTLVYSRAIFSFSNTRWHFSLILMNIYNGPIHKLSVRDTANSLSNIYIFMIFLDHTQVVYAFYKFCFKYIIVSLSLLLCFHTACYLCNIPSLHMYI